MNDLDAEIEAASRHLGALVLRKALGGVKLTDDEVLALIGSLTERQQYVIMARFGLDGKLTKRLDEVAAARLPKPVTRERIRQIEASALQAMRSKVDPSAPKLHK